MQKNGANRRNVLKKLGATTVGIGLAAGSASATHSVGGDDVKVYISFARPEDSSTANNEVYDALDGFLTRLENEGAIPGYDLSVATYAWSEISDDPGRSDDPCDPGPLYDNVSENDYYDVRLYVTDEAMYAGAEHEHAWDDTAADAWVGTSGNYNVDTDDVTGRIKNASIQETAHTMIDTECIVDPYDSDHSGDQEHALGKIYSGSPHYREASPMLVYYESSEAGCRNNDLTGKGDCTSTADWKEGTHTQYLTDCPVTAIKKSFCKNWDPDCTNHCPCSEDCS